jgi:hypothetical protein
LKSKNDKDDGLVRQKTQNSSTFDKLSENYLVGDVIVYDGNRQHGYIIESRKDFLKVVSDNGTI